MKQSIQQLRKEVSNIIKARNAGTGSFETLAALNKSKVHTCKYNELDGIFCDTMAVHKGRTVITHENLQYYPAKIRFYYV